MLTSVAVVVLENVSPFELGTLCEVFGTDRSGQGLPTYEFSTCSPGGAPVRARSGFLVTPSNDLTPLATADVVAVPAMGDPHIPYPPELLRALRDAEARGAYVLSVCSGAFVLGAAGLLDNRRCTTHWMYADELARRHPRAEVDPDVLYVADGRVLTSAGTASGIDLCLDLIRREQGFEVATKLARRMVVPPHREGGQAQYIERPIPPTPHGASLEPLLSWMVGHLDEPMTVESLAFRAHMSPRTFARRFRAETGATPHDWLVAQRLLLARELLEQTSLTVDTIAVRSGFGNAATLRHHFGRRLDTSPQAYRRTFRRTSSPVSA